MVAPSLNLMARLAFPSLMVEPTELRYQGNKPVGLVAKVEKTF
jgi:hypothetical protein